MSNFSEKFLLSPEEAARMLNIGRTTLYRYHSAGKLPLPIHLGGLKWRKRELVDWIAAGCPPRVRWEWNVGKEVKR